MATDMKSVISSVLLFVLIFGFSASSSPQSMAYHVSSKTGIVTGVCCQFLVMPVMGFLSVKLFGLEQSIGTTLLVICSSPGGSYSNWWCSLFNADLSLSVAMTSVSTIFSIAFLPLNLYLYSSIAYGDGDSGENYDHNDSDSRSSSGNITNPQDSLDWVTIGISLSVVLAAIVCGLLFAIKYSHEVDDKGSSSPTPPPQNIDGRVLNDYEVRETTPPSEAPTNTHSPTHRKISEQHSKRNIDSMTKSSNRVIKTCTIMGNLAGVVLILSSFFISSSTKAPIWNRSLNFYAGVAFPCFFALLISWFLTSFTRLAPPERVAIAIETSYQNIGIATSVVLSLFDGDDEGAALGVPLFYGEWKPLAFVENVYEGTVCSSRHPSDDGRRTTTTFNKGSFTLTLTLFPLTSII